MKTRRISHLQLVRSNSVDNGERRSPQRKRPFDELRLLSREAKELCLALSTTLSHSNQVDQESADLLVIGELLDLRDRQGMGFRNISPHMIWERLRYFISNKIGFRFDLKPNGLPNIVQCNCTKRTVEIAQIQMLGHQEYGQYYLDKNGQILGMCTACINQERVITKRQRRFGRKIQNPHFVSYAKADLHRHRKLRRERFRRPRHNRKNAAREMRREYPSSLHLRVLTLMKP